jgi:arginyl-tRNA synthetase
MGVWGVMQKESEKPVESATLQEKVTFLGKCYAYANEQFENSEEAKKGIIEVNKAIYAGTDAKVMEVYAEGRALSLEYFDSLYGKLGTTFDTFIYESEVSEPGLALVREYLKKGIFEESEGAIVYKGEQDGLHTRVFVNKEGLPTYEAKDLGNYEKKLQLLPNASHYVVITASEQKEYFKVINKVAEKIHTSLVGKLTHISHGMMRLASGKMSSRTGNVIGGEDLLNEIKEHLKSKIEDMRVEESNKESLLNAIAVGAIKFSILKIAPGKDIIFDFEKSISFEGDSGPYLQYTHARLCALLDKAEEKGIDFEHGYVVENPEHELEKVIIGYKEVLEKTFIDLGPQHVIQHLLLLTRVFNNMYARVQIVNEESVDTSRYYVMLASAKRILESISLKMFPAEPEVPAVEDVADVSQVALENVTPSVPLEQYVVRDTPEKTLPEVPPTVAEPVISKESSESVDLVVFDRVLSSMGDLETQLHLVSSEISTLRAANVKLKLDKSALELEIQTSKMQLAKSEKETERLTVENHSLSEENKRLRQELHSAQQSMDVVRKAMQPK